MSEKCYSHDEEVFEHDTAEEAAEYLLDISDAEIKKGFMFNVWEGDIIPNRAGDFIPNYISESMGENAYDNIGECSAEWPNETEDQREELQKMVEAAVNEWADNHALHPTFYAVGKTQEVWFKVTDENLNFERVPSKSK